MQHGIVRHKIVETASRLFYTKGYNLTGINQIIEEAGIAKATLYSHFRSKEDICIAYLEYKDQAFFEELRPFLETYPKGTERIMGLFDFLTRFYEGDHFNGCWCLNTVSEIPKENTRIRETIQKGKKVLIALIETLVEDLSITNAKKSELAQQIYLLYESGLSESHLHQKVWPIHSARAICDQLLT